MPLDPLSRVLSSTAVRRFAIQAGVVFVLFTTLAIVGIYLRTQQLVMAGVNQKAESFLDLIVTTRGWNAGHGGVWVEKHTDSDTNAYLRHLGVEPDTSTVSGVPLTLRNPAAMTREISELISENDEVRFRLTSLEPVNPGNTPDAWESEQLRKFAVGDTKAGDTVTADDDGDGRVFRMMRPLVTDDSCLRCHGVQGYTPGDIRGALSVSIELDDIDAELRRNAWGLCVLWLLAVGSLGFVMFGLVLRMAARIERGESKLKIFATTDELTGLANRRTTLERLASELARSGREASPVGVIEVDVDRFKQVNDTHGHPAGDAVLAAVATAMTRSVRPYDVVGRIGGEEFLVVAPAVDADGLVALAERIRVQVEGETVAVDDGTEVRVTVSAGCALSSGDDESLEDLLRRADSALYAAKDNGRNRVESA